VALDTAYLAETPEGIALALSPAGPVARFGAFLVDSLIRFALWFALVMLLFWGGLGRVLVFVGLFAIEWIYPIVFELAMGGATPGKRAFGLQVVMDSGLPVTPAASITRNLLRVADFMPAAYALGAVCMMLRPDFKRLGDLAAGTIVVHARAVSLHAELPASTPVAPARALSLREQAAIVSWAGRASSLTPERLEELAQLARPAMQPSGPGVDASIALLGVAQWLIGRRGGEAP